MKIEWFLFIIHCIMASVIGKSELSVPMWARYFKKSKNQ